MVVEEEILPYWEWLLGDWWRGGPAMGAGLRFVVTALVVAVVAVLVGFLVALVRHGPLKAGDLTYRVVVNGLAELSRSSWRRIWALARLAIKESIHRRVAVAVVVFLLVLLFAGWFLQTGYREPGKLFFSFALTTTTYLLLFIALLVSAFSLPHDFKSKAIYTVVTKPVRAGDIVLGRILGFTLVGTVLLAIMAAGSAVFVWRMLDHTHEVEIASVEDILDVDGNVIGSKGRTSSDHSHRHEVELDLEGNGFAYYANGHEHAVHGETRGGELAYEVSGPLEIMRARVPEYGDLRFLNRHGVPEPRGISVGAEWTYRSYIDGGSSAAAIWLFDDIDESKLQRADDGGQVLPLELIVRVFRTYKGIIGQGIRGSIQLRNPDSGRESSLRTFTAKDAAGGVSSADKEPGSSDTLPSVNSFPWPRKLEDKDRQPIDLLDDLVSEDGRLEVVVRCLEREQYYGFARPDCYVRLPDGSPFWNYCKAQLSIWIQMVVVIAIAVAISTLVNGPVAMLFTVSFITLGFFRDFFVSVAAGTQAGGGPVESFVRLITQRNLTSGLQDNENFGVNVMHMVDSLLETAMRSVAYLLPDFSSFRTADYVAYGFNIPLDKVFQDLTFGVTYVAGVCVFGHFFLRTREVAK